MTTVAPRRIQKELSDLCRKQMDHFSVVPSSNGGNQYNWKGAIVGPQGTPYEGGIFFLDINFDNEYPFKAPRVTFVTRIYHPNIHEVYGTICHAILYDDYSPTLSMR